MVHRAPPPNLEEAHLPQTRIPNTGEPHPNPTLIQKSTAPLPRVQDPGQGAGVPGVLPSPSSRRHFLPWLLQGQDTLSE